MRIISPSMLAADFGNLKRDTELIHRSAAEWIHIDVMDGYFVPNISFGFPVIEAIDRHSDKVMDVHLMIVEPERYVERFAKSGADIIVFHIEATEKPWECIRLIRECGVKVGISVKPATPVEVLAPYLSMIDLVLVMSVEPGFGGQKFMPESIEKCRQLRAMSSDLLIEVDGGIGASNAGLLFEAGADAVVAGSSVFGAEDPEAEIVKILNA